MASNLRVDTILPSTGTSLGIGTANGSITVNGSVNSLTVSGNLGIGGTLTYEDVTNIDSIGIITARSTVSIADSIVHTGDTDTSIRFPTADTIAAEVGGNEALRIDSSRRLLVGRTSGSFHLEVAAGSDSTFRITNLNESGHGTVDAKIVAGGSYYQNPTIVGSSIKFRTYNGSSEGERLRITSAGDLLFMKTSPDQQATGIEFEEHGLAKFTKDNIVAYFTRTSSDGQMIRFYGDTTSEGSINISGTSISYNGGVLSRWSQIVGISTNNKADRPTIYQGTVMSNLDEMCDWGDEENMQLNKTQVSNVSGDKNVAGVFWAWDDDDDTYLNDYYVAQTGDYIIRVGASTTVARGDLLESAGDGTAKPQSDDIVRSKTVAKVTSGIAHTTYPDGTKTYPCVLMAS